MKMLRSWQERVDDMIGALDEIQGFVAGMEYEQFRADRKTQMAVLADLFVAGQTAGKLLSDHATQRGVVPWERLRDLRVTLSHGRAVHDVQELWTTVKAELPELAASLRAFASMPFEDDLPALD